MNHKKKLEKKQEKKQEEKQEKKKMSVISNLYLIKIFLIMRH